MADLLAPPAPPPLAPDERRKLLSAARRHRAAWLDDLCVDLAATRRRRACSLVDAICADAIPSAGAVVRALCKAAGDDGAVLPPGAFVADALDLARAQPDSTREGAAALAEALKHPRHAEAARALERGGRGLGDVAELAARLASEVGADVEAAEALVRRARALYGDAAAAATTVAAAPAAAPAPRAAQQRNRVTARAVRARRTGTSSSPS